MSTSTQESTGTVSVDLEIHNVYSDAVVVTHVRRAVVARPAAHTGDEFADWSLAELFPYTGAGREEGDATYSVLISDSTEPTLRGRRVEFG